MSIVNAHDFVNMTANNFTDYYEEYVDGADVDYEGGLPRDHPFYIPPAPRIILTWMRIIFTVVGGSSDLLIAYTSFRYTRMRTKTNMIIANVAIMDALALLTRAEIMIELHRHLALRGHGLCQIAVLDCCFQYGAFAFIIALNTNWIMKRSTVGAIRVICTIYVLSIIAIIVNSAVCAFVFFPVSYPLWAILFGVLFLLVLLKELNNCYKKYCKKDPLSSRTKMRLNIGRIYIYNWVIRAITFTFYRGIFRAHQQYYWEFLGSTTYLSGFYILIYLFINEKYYKASLMDIFTCQRKEDYEEDAAITFREQHNEDDEV